MRIFAGLPLLSQIFIVSIVSMTILFHLRFNSKTESLAPTILTTTGIFSTFIGIAIGLSNFDSGSIESSVPILLGGLKTAFWASVAGVGGALTLKYRQYIFGKRSAWVRNSDTYLQYSDISRILAEISSRLQAVQWSLSTSEPLTFASQSIKAGLEPNNKIDFLAKTQGDSLQTISRESASVLVVGLGQIIDNFNTKIPEQFGKNIDNLAASLDNVASFSGINSPESKELITEISNSHRDTIVALNNAAKTFGEFGNHVAKFDLLAGKMERVAQSLAKLDYPLVDDRGLERDRPDIAGKKFWWTRSEKIPQKERRK